MSGDLLHHWLDDLDHELRSPDGVRSILLALTPQQPADDESLFAVVHQALRDPVYQLK